MRKKNTNWTIFTFATIVASLLIIFPAPSERILNIQNYLITVSGIISAFVIAYLSSKVFNLRSERSSRRIEIDQHADKLTMFRRLLYFVMQSRDFWVYYDDVKKFKKQYEGLDYHNLHGHGGNEKVAEFWVKEKKLSLSTIDLYCAMEWLSGTSQSELDPTIPWQVDKAVRFDYSLEELRSYYEPCNQIWYYLEGRFAKQGKGRFEDTGIYVLYENDVRDLITRLNTRYKGKDFHRLILAELATEIYEIVLPRLIDLVQQNRGIPITIIKTFNSLLFIMGIGVICPIILQSLNVIDSVNVILTLLFVWLTTLGLLTFMLDFYQFMSDEVHMTEN